VIDAAVALRRGEDLTLDEPAVAALLWAVTTRWKEASPRGAASDA
jgi:hypothetical protein